jgi:hypothetical protein
MFDHFGIGRVFVVRQLIVNELVVGEHGRGTFRVSGVWYD